MDLFAWCLTVFLILISNVSYGIFGGMIFSAILLIKSSLTPTILFSTIFLQQPFLKQSLFLVNNNSDDLEEMDHEIDQDQDQIFSSSFRIDDSKDPLSESLISVRPSDLPINSPISLLNQQHQNNHPTSSQTSLLILKPLCPSLHLGNIEKLGREITRRIENHEIVVIDLEHIFSIDQTSLSFFSSLHISFHKFYSSHSLVFTNQRDRVKQRLLKIIHMKIVEEKEENQSTPPPRYFFSHDSVHSLLSSIKSPPTHTSINHQNQQQDQEMDQNEEEEEEDRKLDESYL